MQPHTDYERLAARYDAGRSLPLEWVDEWRPVLAPYLRGCARPLLDLGSGTGLWSETLAGWFDLAIVAVEPSDAMRRSASHKRLPAAQVGGTAERIPLKKGSCDCAWLSTVLHHIPEPETCARELRRVLSERGTVLIRNSFGDRLDDVHWLRFWPAAKALAAKRWPTVAATADAFRAGGFEVEALVTVPEVIASDLHAYHERLSVRANSTLTLISDEDFADGLARLKRAADRGPDREPVVDHRDLLVLR